MQRKDFLKLTGLLGASALLPLSQIKGRRVLHSEGASCELIPSETAGPYPLDLSNDSTKFRQDIRESFDGIQLNMKLRINNATTCNPIANTRVDLWHCDKDGYYSGYTVNGYLGQQNHKGETFFRGIQITDANGEVEFITILPGWYDGRATHIHFQVFLSSVLQATSQIAFDTTAVNSIYTSSSKYSAHGANPMTNQKDMVFSDGTTYQMVTLTDNTTTGGFDAFLNVNIKGGNVGLMNLEPETGGQFKLGQNYPNPYHLGTTIPFNLTNPSDIKIDLFDLNGRKITTIEKEDLGSGDHTVYIDLDKPGLAAGNYVYQLEVSNKYGVYRQCKMMSAE